MKQLILQRAVVPPGGWRVRCPHCSHRIWAQTYPDFVALINKHNAANQHDLWDWETQLCENMPPGICQYENGAPGAGLQCEMDSKGLMAGALAVTGFVSKAVLEATGISVALGIKSVFVDQAEAERRAAICTRCSKNVPVNGCGGCSTMQGALEMLGRVKGERKTSADASLQGCCICLCHLPTIVHIRKDLLSLTPEQRDLTEKVAPHCWKVESA